MNEALQKRKELVVPNTPEEPPVTSISPRFALLIFVGIGIFLWLVRAILLPFVIAGAIAFVFSPAVDWLAKVEYVPRWVAAAWAFVVIVAIAGLFGYAVYPIITHDFLPMVTNLEGTIAHAAHRLIGNGTIGIFGERLNAQQIGQKAVDLISNWLGQNGEILSLAALAFTAAFGVILTIVLLAYFLIGGPQIKAGLLWLVPPRQRRITDRVWHGYPPLLRRYLIGIAIIVIYAGVAAYVGLGLVLQVRHAPLLAVMTGFFELIPVVGPAASAIIAGIAAIQSGDTFGGVTGYAIYATFLRVSIDQLIAPLVLGRAARVHPVLIIFCFLAGGILFGIPGVLLAVPLALAIKIILATAYGDPRGIEEAG
ncbi:MAG TPA: AI-2E family transporter [Methylocella sp.]|nr:AI-2E family transporter [Methylocella sp.]